MTHVDPAKQLLANEIEKRYPARQHPERGALKAVLSGESELVVEIPDSLLDEATHDEEHARLIRQLGIRSAMVVPLMARERAIGAITLVSAESGRAFELDDLRLAEELAGRAAIAVDNARLYGERSYIASTLQQALMPDNLPELPGAELAARYSAAGEVNEVGGDFYDIYRLGEATWGLAIGDVRGKGPRAAAVTALVRYTLRTASLGETVPSRVLAVLNEAMLRHSADDRFCTAAYASIHPNGRGGFRMTLGVGGHPLPLVLRRDGSVEPVGSPGTLIGFVPDPEIVDEHFELQPGDALVLYTDGVSEARSAHDLYGEERLMRLLGRCAGLGAAEIAERIENEVLDFQEGAASDDLAVLVLRVHDRRRLDGALEVELLEPVRKAPA
jgi:serine phosphatase RsbU (regulator of sigma subunit)